MMLDIIRGYVMCYKVTKNAHYLRQARKLANKLYSTERKQTKTIHLRSI